jgi:hypothetical protein
MPAETNPDELLSALAELRRLKPAWRLGQTLVNLAGAAGRRNATAVWDLTDEEALTAVRQLIEQDGESSTLTATKIRAAKKPT